jgi:hypothetical protein
VGVWKGWAPAVAGARSPLMTGLAGGSMLRSAWLSRRQPPHRRASPAPPRSENGLCVSYAHVRYFAEMSHVLAKAGLVENLESL